MDNRQCNAPTRNQAEICKGSSAVDIRAESASAKLRQLNQTDKRNEATMEWLHSCWSILSSERTINLEKTAKMNWLLFLLSVSAGADAFLQGITSGRKINYPFDDAIHEKNQTSQDSNARMRPKIPQIPIL